MKMLNLMQYIPPPMQTVPGLTLAQSDSERLCAEKKASLGAPAGELRPYEVAILTVLQHRI